MLKQNTNFLEGISPNLDRLLELYLNYINHVPSGEVPKEFHELKEKIEHDLKLANELRSTHQFYNESKNGFCAGVTRQILNLSNYGGKPCKTKESEGTT